MSFFGEFTWRSSRSGAKVRSALDSQPPHQAKTKPCSRCMNPQPKIQSHLEKWRQKYLSNMFSKSLMTRNPTKTKKSSKPKAHLLAQMLRHCVGITFWKEHVPQQILRWGLTVSRRITSKIDAFSPISVAFGVPPISGTPSPTLLPTKSLNHFHLALRKPKSPTTN